MSIGKKRSRGKNSSRKAAAKKSNVETSVKPSTTPTADTVNTLATDPTIESQATRLADQEIPAAQRQAMAAQIGRLTGNQTLQRVMVQANRLKTKPAPEITVSTVKGQSQGESVQREDTSLVGLEGARKIHKAIKGLGTDLETVFEVLAANVGKGAALNKKYKLVSGGESLKRALIDDLSGKDLYKAWTLYYGSLNVKKEAKLLNIAMKDSGTDNELFWETLDPYEHRSVAERRALMAAYDRYGNLMEHIDDDFDFGDFEKAAMLLAFAPTPPLSKEDQEAEARWTAMLCHQAVEWLNSKTSDEIYKNTAALFDLGRLKHKALTLRHDSYKLVAMGGHDPRTKAYFFVGPKQDNERTHGPKTRGTIEKNVVLIRGTKTDSNGLPTKAVRSKEGIGNTMIHEASHILVESYKEYPKSDTDAGSFDRYKDEFRAYWISPEGAFKASKFATAELRAAKIRKHLVGTGPKASDTTYKKLQFSYHGSADHPQSTGPDMKFKRAVDSHIQPDTYNLKNNPQLDKLFGLIDDYPSIFTEEHYKETRKFIKEDMTALERLAAAASPLILKALEDEVGNAEERLLLMYELKKK